MHCQCILEFYRAVMKNHVALGLEDDPNTEHGMLSTPITPTKAPKAVTRIPRPSVPCMKDGTVIYSQYIDNALLVYCIHQ
jgi:hypothetical protein